MAPLVNGILSLQIALGLVYLLGSWFRFVPGYGVYAVVFGLCLFPMQVLAIIQGSRAKAQQSMVFFPVPMILTGAIAAISLFSLHGGDVSQRPDWEQARFLACFMIIFASVQRGILKASRYI